jgi:hypothetical protein
MAEPYTEAEFAEYLDAITDPANPEFDAEFTAWLRAQRPDWFPETVH